MKISFQLKPEFHHQPVSQYGAGSKLYRQGRGIDRIFHFYEYDKGEKGRAVVAVTNIAMTAAANIAMTAPGDQTCP